MISTSFFQMLPILLVARGGYVPARRHSLRVEDLVILVSDFFFPALIFSSLAQSELSGDVIIDIAIASALVCILLFALALFWAKLFKQEIRSTVPPLLFMNSGFLGIPLMKLWGSLDAMNLILVYDQIQGVFMFTIGILIITGGGNKERLHSLFFSPILWAVGLGFLARFLRLPIPSPLMSALTFAGEAASPLAAFTLGVSLRKVGCTRSANLVTALLLRFVGGFFIGYLAASLLHLSLLARTVVIVATTLPSVVFTSVLPLRYGLDNQFSSAMVLTSTILGMFTIPISFVLARML